MKSFIISPLLILSQKLYSIFKYINIFQAGIELYDSYVLGPENGTSIIGYSQSTES